MKIIWTNEQFNDVDFGIAVKKERRKLGMSQAELSAVLGYATNGVINVIERGRGKGQLKVRDFMALCNFLEIAPSQFFEPEGTEGASISQGWEL